MLTFYDGILDTLPGSPEIILWEEDGASTTRREHGDDGMNMVPGERMPASDELKSGGQNLSHESSSSAEV